MLNVEKMRDLDNVRPVDPKEFESLSRPID